MKTKVLFIGKIYVRATATVTFTDYLSVILSPRTFSSTPLTLFPPKSPNLANLVTKKRRMKASSSLALVPEALAKSRLPILAFPRLCGTSKQ